MRYPVVFSRMFLVAFAVGGLAFGAFLVWQNLRQRDLASSYQTTPGVITELTQQHGFVRYSYKVSGEEHRGFAKPRFRVEVGESVDVFVATQNPSNSSLLVPRTPDITDYVGPAIVLAGSLLVGLIARKPSTMKWSFGPEQKEE